jgi:hypothetical protein
VTGTAIKAFISASEVLGLRIVMASAPRQRIRGVSSKTEEGIQARCPRK